MQPWLQPAPQPCRHTPDPIQLIAGALLRGWTVAHVGKTMKAYMMPPSKFREIVAIAYEAIDAPRDFEPERALRAYRALQKKEAGAEPCGRTKGH